MRFLTAQEVFEEGIALEVNRRLLHNAGIRMYVTDQEKLGEAIHRDLPDISAELAAFFDQLDAVTSTISPEDVYLFAMYSLDQWAGKQGLDPVVHCGFQEKDSPYEFVPDEFPGRTKEVLIERAKRFADRLGTLGNYKPQRMEDVVGTTEDLGFDQPEDLPGNVACDLLGCVRLRRPEDLTCRWCAQAIAGQYRREIIAARSGGAV